MNFEYCSYQLIANKGAKSMIYNEKEFENNLLSFHHICIKAQDIETTVQFYQKLGFQIKHDWALPSFNIKYCAMMHHPKINVYLEIADKDAAMPTQGRKKLPDEDYVENALQHICFMVRDAQLAANLAISYGAQPLTEVLNIIELVGVSFNKNIQVKNTLVYSPNGEVIEFLEYLDF